LHTSFVPPLPVTPILVLSQGARCADAPPCKRHGRFTPGVLAPVRVIVSRSITAYPTPSAPLAGTSRFRRTAAYTRCLRCAPACGRLGDHRVVPSFRVLLCIGMSSPGTPGSLSAAYTQFLHRRRWPSTESKGLGASHIPTLRFSWGTTFRGFTAVHFRYNLPTCSPRCRS
jgi:hypothetical protein